MKLPITYKGIMIDHNIWYGLGDKTELKYMVYTPDIERYSDDLETAKHIVDVFTLKNGRAEFYRRRQDNEIFNTRQ